MQTAYTSHPHMNFWSYDFLFFNLEILMGAILYIKNLSNIRISEYISQLYFNTIWHIIED